MSSQPPHTPPPAYDILVQLFFRQMNMEKQGPIKGSLLKDGFFLPPFWEVHLKILYWSLLLRILPYLFNQKRRCKSVSCKLERFSYLTVAKISSYKGNTLIVDSVPVFTVILKTLWISFHILVRCAPLHHCRCHSSRRRTLLQLAWYTSTPSF